MEAEAQLPARVPYLPKVIALAAIVLCYACVQWISSRELFSSRIHHSAEIPFQLVVLFEHHIWQFAIGMLAILILSRGHLWSYGINSMNIRLSMTILLRFYVVAFVFVLVTLVIPTFPKNRLPYYFATMNGISFVGWMVFQWLATAVADEIFFHGLFQTVLLKYWKEEFVFSKIKIPVAILFSTIIFASGRTNIPIYGGSDFEYILAIFIGLFTGWVYYKTKSLLTPMLSQAFFYGMPFFVRYITMHF